MLQNITYTSSCDQKPQPAFFRKALTQNPRPLVIALHTWSGDYTQPCDNYSDFCEKADWNFIFPNFRGPNWTPEGLGSEFAVQDIVDARTFAINHANVDMERIYLIGGSGGGHMALLMAGRHPELWAAVCAWCPISDVAQWFDQCTARQLCYAEHIEQACGSMNCTANRQEALRRSGISYLQNAVNLPLSINTGIHDGHTGSVPVSQTFEAFNKLAPADQRFSAAEIEFMVKNEKICPGLEFDGVDPAYGKYKVLLRRNFNKVQVSIFEGGHDILSLTGLAWLKQQRLNQPPVWEVGPLDVASTELGK